eukprot:COSAG02_NODE_858_length_16456_cov_7.419698_2_plen_48_part_00
MAERKKDVNLMQPVAAHSWSWQSCSDPTSLRSLVARSIIYAVGALAL